MTMTGIPEHVPGQMDLVEEPNPDTQKAEVLSMLRQAGDTGVLSKVLYERFMGRGAARIYDLKQAGHKIVSVREGKYCRYFLEEQ